MKGDKRKQAYPALYLKKKPQKITPSTLVKVVGIYKQAHKQIMRTGEQTWVKITSEAKIVENLCTKI